MYDLKDITAGNFQLFYEYIGEVIDNADPLYRGRLKCKIYGVTENTNSDELPWCETMGELFGSNKTTASFSSAPKLNTLVYIKFLYGNPSHPVISGYVRGNMDSSNAHKVANLGESIYNTRNTNMIGPELPPLNESSVYPKNNVIETDSCVIEIDDTGRNERVSIQHKNGSFVELRPNGTVQIKAQKDLYSIIKGNIEEYVENCVHQVIRANYTQEVNGDVTTTIGGNVNNTIGGDLAEAIAGAFTLTASGNLTINNDVKIVGNLQVTEVISAIGNITSSGLISDSEGQLSSLRDTFENHTHIQNAGDDYGAGGTTTNPNQTVPTTRPTDFVQTSTSSGVSATECGSADVYMEPARVDGSEGYYNSNVKPQLESSDVPESYPRNQEQVEETTQQVVEGVVGDQKNPFEVGEQLLNLGTKAWQETGNNPNIRQLWDEIGYNGNQFADETAWCAVFVSAVLKRSGNKYIKTASSQAYKNYGVEVPHISQAKVGDILVFYRKGTGSGYGHVGFYAGSYNDSYIAMLGGNQSNNLNVRYFKRLDESKGWGLRTIRRAVSANDGTSVPPDYSYTIPSNIFKGGKVT